MKIWKIKPNKSSISLVSFDPQKFIEFELPYFDGEVLPVPWPKEYRLITDNQKYKYNDYAIYLNHIPVISEKVFKIVTPLVNDLVQFLPVQHSDFNFYICNIINVIECVDAEKSIPDTILDGEIRSYSKISFLESVLKNNEKRHIFKIPELTRLTYFVSDEFRELLLANNIKGIDFIEIWDSEADFELEQQHEQRIKEAYDAHIIKINNQPHDPLSWNEAIEKLKLGKAAISADWKIQYNSKGDILIGELNRNLEYEFFSPVYIPPILLDLTWQEVDKSTI